MAVTPSTSTISGAAALDHRKALVELDRLRHTTVQSANVTMVGAS
jgi:hypothetical protein